MNHQSNIFRPIGTPLERGEGALPHGSECTRACTKCLDGMSLAMVYSPCQEFDVLYEPMEALHAGTLFHLLDKPFLGARRVK